MSPCKKISLSVLIFVILLLEALTFLVSTTSGLRLLFNTVNHWIPGLEISQIAGKWYDLYLKISYQQPGIAVNINEFHCQIKFTCLRNSKLCINNLSLKNVNVSIDTKKMLSSVQIEKRDINSPIFYTSYPIDLYRIILNDINVKINDVAISIMNISSGLHWQEKNLFLKPTLLHGLVIILPKMIKVTQKNVVKSKIYSLQQEKALGKILQNIILKSTLPKITKIHLPLNLNIEEFTGKQLNLIGNTNLTIYNMMIKASSIENNIKLIALNIDTDHGSLSATGSALLRDKWPVDIILRSTLNICQFNGEKIKFRLNGALLDELKLNIKFSGPMTMILCGRVKLTEDGLPLNFEVAGKQLFWPLIYDKQFQANNVQLKLKGKITNYTLSFRTSIKGKNVPAATIMFEAKGNDHQINLNKLTVATLGGKTELVALINWQQAISWYCNLKLIGINTRKEIPDWPFKLNGLIKTSGNLYSDTWQAEVSKIELTGNLKHDKIKIYGSLKGNSYLQWIIPSLHVEIGRNIADIKGELGGKYLDLDIAIDAPNLSNTLPEVSGTVKGIIKVRNTIKTPQLLINFIINSLHWQNIHITNMLVDGNVKFADQISGKLNLRVEHLVYPEMNINSITLAIRGSEEQHDLKLRVHGDYISGQLHLAGSFYRQTECWEVQLDNTNFNMLSWPLTVAFNTLNLSLRVYNNYIQLNWLMQLTNNSYFKGQVKVNDPQGQRNLSGTISIHNFNLITSATFSHSEKVAGILNANLRLLGNTQSPQLFGNIYFNGFDMDSNLMPFGMQLNYLGLNFNGMNSTLIGIVRTSQGQIKLKGRANWSHINNWRSRVTASGSCVRITISPMVKMDISPEVVFDGTENMFNIYGKVDVPWAYIVVHDVPKSAVSISNDEVLLNRNLKPVKRNKNTSIQINSDLIIHIGNNVWLDAFGLKTKLTGDLKVTQDKQGLGLNGQVNVDEGRFHAYGLDLIVRKGELLFAGSPDQPVLNIEAIRNPDATEDDIIVGMRITGSTDELKTEIFSDSVMSQQETLSYLLRGQKLDNDQSDNATMTSILIGLGIAQSGQVIDKIGETFGIRNLALDTQGIGDFSQVVVSGYVLPNLQIKYGMGIFDSLATLTLRYRLMPKLYLEAVSGINQTLDLLYQFEF